MTNNENLWEADMSIISCINVIIPVKLYLVCNQIAGRVNGNEFSIVTDIQEKDKDIILLKDSFYIPKQKVSPANIDYLPDTYQHNVCIHRHPDGCVGFSSTDREFINQNFELSLLYTKRDGFVNGIYNMKIDEKTLIQLPVEIKIDYNLENVNLENIIQEKQSLIDELREFKLSESGNEKKEEEIDRLENRLDCLEDLVYYKDHYDYGHF